MYRGESITWRVLQNAKREQTHAMCLNAMVKYEKVDSVNTQNNYETTSKK